MSKKSGASPAFTQRFSETVVIDSPIDAEEYLRKLMASNKFSSMVDEFMSRFGESFEVVLKEKDKDVKMPSGKTLTAKVVKPDTKPAASGISHIKSVLPIQTSDIEHSVQSGEKYDLVTVKNDKMAAGFLLPKNDKARAKLDESAKVLETPNFVEPKPKVFETFNNGAQITETAAQVAAPLQVPIKPASLQEVEEWSDVGCPPKPRNFLEAALYFSTVTLGTVSMANQLSLSVFFAPPILTTKETKEFNDVFLSRRMIESKGKSSEYESQKLLQRRISALFAVALSQSSPNIRPFAASASERMASSVSSNLTKTNYLKRSIGFFAVSLVDHLPSSMASRLFKNGADPGGLGAAALGLDDLRVPSPETLGQFWLGLDHPERISLVQAEIQNLSKGWINSRKTWCMCRYCKHRRLRLSDIFDHVYRAYHDELVELDCRLRGVDAPFKTPHQVKIRKLLYKALTVVAEDILNTKSRLMLEAISRLGRAYHEEALHINCGEDGICWAEEGRQRRRKCHCPDCDYYFEGENGRDGQDEYDDESGEECSDYDDLDIDEDGDFYEDFNYGEDDEYIQMEGDNPVDEAQLPSTLPSFYDMDLMWSAANNGNQKATGALADPCIEGQLLFEAFINQIFQFHLVPAFLEHKAFEKQKELIMEEEEAEKLAKLREEQKHLAKKEKKERQRAARAAQKAAEEEEAAKKKRLEDEIAAAAAKARAEEEARIARQQIVQAKKKEAAAKKKPLLSEEPAIVPRKPVTVNIDTSSFAVEDIAVANPAASEEASHGLSKSAKRKKKKAAAAAMETESTVSSINNAAVSGFINEDLPPGLFGGSFGSLSEALLSPPSHAQSPVIDPPPPYSIFAADLGIIDESLMEPLEPSESMTNDEPSYLPVNLDLFPPSTPSSLQYQRSSASQSRFESLFGGTSTSPVVARSDLPPSFNFELFNQPSFNRRFMQEPTQTRPHQQSMPSRMSPPPGYRLHDQSMSGALPTIYQANRSTTCDQTESLSSANDPLYRPPPASYESSMSTPVVPGQEGFNPFEDWSPVRSSLFSRPLFNDSPQQPRQQQTDIRPPGPIGNGSKNRYY